MKRRNFFTSLIGLIGTPAALAAQKPTAPATANERVKALWGAAWDNADEIVVEHDSAKPYPRVTITAKILTGRE